MIEPYYQDETVTLYYGDCLEVMRELPDGCVDGLITDPPYSSGGMFRGDRTQKASTKYVQTDSEITCRNEFGGDNRDQRAFLSWAGIWMGIVLRKSKSGAVACVFTDWRQLPTMTDAVQIGGWVWRNIVTWWKPGIRMQRGRFSSSCEYVVYASAGIPSEGECSPQNVLRISSVNGEDKSHIAEKPVDLLQAILGVTPRASTILDPFMGSGTTGVACVKTGRRFIGIEIDEGYCAIAKRRILAEKAQGKLALEMMGNASR